MIRSSYNCQLAVTEGQVIVGAGVVTEKDDQKQLAPMIEQVEEVLEEEIKEVIADSGYASYENYEYLYQRDKEGYIPDHYFGELKRGKYKRPEKKYHKENFQYNEERDIYICPEGKELKFYKQQDRDNGVTKNRYRIYRGMGCLGCPALTKCTKTKHRIIARESREELQKAMRQKLLTEQGKNKYKKRLYTVEPIFGHLKYNLGYRNFLLRTLEKVRGEFKLMCIGYNLRKIFTFKMAMA